MSATAIIPLSQYEIDYLKSVKSLIMKMDHEQISPSLSIWMYDAFYLPINNELAKHGHAKHDDGQLS